MPKINVYLPDGLAEAVRDAQIPISAVCQAALERAVRDVSALRSSDDVPLGEPAHGPFVRFTPRARKAIELAQQRALERGHDHVGTEHVLLGLIDEGGNLALRVLSVLDVEAVDLRDELVASLPPAGKRGGAAPPFLPMTKKALELTATEAQALGHNFIGCEHLLLGTLAAEDSLGSQVLRRMGLELRTTRRAVVTALAEVVQAQDKPRTAPPSIASALDAISARLDAIERRIPPQ